MRSVINLRGRKLIFIGEKQGVEITAFGMAGVEAEEDLIDFLAREGLPRNCCDWARRR